MKFVILAALLAVSVASYNNNVPGYFGSLAYSNPATSEPNYHTSVNSVNSAPVYSTPVTPVITYSALEVDNVSPVSAAYEVTTNKFINLKINDSGVRNVYATSTVGGGEYEHTTASTHVITSAYKEPEYSPTSIPTAVVSAPTYRIPPTTAVPVYVAEEKILPYWLRPGYY
ncbi:hypothetical protein DAPPUDRAFT_314973 [Daphnia pulex]|uniref:Cuticle protein n=1 Tax=Daphnia pulex TaxID=6669 RepID=E9G897_DAPPU|nr:hypothetical protein DAPPUDRAFT_314973 [Daphnia pulex]|eukprot:EFX84312.1 hypothetical protein DAPPUDRAFT_314973 [Daphnia pulex]